MSLFIAPKKGVTLNIVANDELATWSRGSYKVWQVVVGSPNIPSSKKLLFNGSGAFLSSAFSSAATVIITNSADDKLFYATGTGPVIPEQGALECTQANPGTLNATGTLTAALLLGGIVTSTTAAAVTATLDTGTNFDAAIDSAAINDAFFWSAINTGGTNAFTVTGGTGHTVVGNGAVAANGSGRFLSRRTAAATWVTYRLS